MNDDLRLPYEAGKLPTLQLGGILLDGKLLENAPVNLVLKSFNRHGLIAGATGSGKTKTMQVLSEQLSQAGVPCVVMDIKGDISGLAEAGESNEALVSRANSLNLPFTPQACPVDMFTLNSEIPGVPLRSTVNEFGSLLFSRMLDINDTQSGVVTVVFEYAKENQIPLIDLEDFKAVLQYVQSDAGKAEVEARFGSVASTSVGTIMRKVIELEAQGGSSFFGEPGFNVLDLLRTNDQGQGIISIVRLMDMQDKPKLFSTFMLKLLSDVYKVFPELGDPPKPKLVLFIDEAHLIFNNASKALLSMLDTMVKLIRSKGVSLIFCTQTPNDVPDAVLSQLGLKIQHALRAFTAKDRQAMKLVAQNFPPSDNYNTEQLLTSLGIGEALLSALDEKGQPTPLIQCLIRAPQSRMGVISEAELRDLVAKSPLFSRYGKRQASRPAAEFLAAKKAAVPVAESGSNSSNHSEKEDASIVTTLTKNTLFRQLVRQTFRQLVNTALKLLNGKKL
jgi:DNA helicase HerA-like ATPase